MKQPSTLVLDTNVVLDWLLFAAPAIRPLQAAVQARQIAILTHQPAIDELQRVLGYPQFRLDGERQAAVLASYLAATRVVPMPAGFCRDDLLLPAKFPRCRDPDDQHFFSLALHGAANALVSRDKAVLKLRKRAATFGVTVLNVQEMIAMLSEPPP